MATTPEQNRANLIWIDLEMTGLDPRTDVILQAAVVITGPDLDELSAAAVDVAQPEAALARMSDLVRGMHTKTGLLDRVRSSHTTLAEAEEVLLACIRRWCVPPATLCGSSVWVDRRFIEAYLPRVEAYLHYRMVDVSSLKILAARWYGESAVFSKAAQGEHDARVDIRNSIAELAHYRRTLFQPLADR